MTNYIHSMTGSVQRQRGYGQNGFELVVTVSFDAKEFNKIKKSKSCPLASGMAQIKNVVLDATGVRGIPGYSAPSYTQRFPRASNGLVTLRVTFDISDYSAQQLGVNTKSYSVYHSVDLNKVLESTRADGHLFPKSVIASILAN